MEYHDACKAGGNMEQKVMKFELEAAEALAGLAHSAVPQNEPVRPTQQLKPGSCRSNDLVAQPQDQVGLVVSKISCFGLTKIDGSMYVLYSYYYIPPLVVQ